MKRTSLLLAAVLCGLVPAAGALRVPAGAVAAEITLPDGYKVAAELALTPEEQAKGLMFRDTLPPGRGMLFVFSEHAPRSFWMKNTFVDLDMVFIDDRLKVVKVFHRVPRSRPGQAEPEIARASSPAALVLELPAGAARAHGVKPGVRLKVAFPKK
jgi:hypothetical protein